MKQLRTYIERDSSNNPIGETVLGQIKILYGDQDQATKATTYNANNNRTVISVNYDICSDDENMTKALAAKKAYGWETKVLEWTEENVLSLVRQYGISNSSYKDNHRSNSETVAYNSIMLDFDKHTETVESLKNDFKNFEGSFFIFSSVNHKPEASKLRVWIPLSRTINESELAFFRDIFLKRFPTLDPTCFSQSRFWYFTPAVETFFSDKKYFLEVDRWIEQTKLESTTPMTTYEDGEVEEVEEEEETTDPKAPKKKVGRAKWTFDGETELLLSDKKTKIKVKDIKGKTRVFCPCCGLNADRGNPNLDNAFVSQNSIGNIFIHCTSEAVTYWETVPSFNDNNYIFMHDISGTACRPTENGYNSFNGNEDWFNYAHHNNLNPNCRVYVPRRRVIFDPGKPPRFFSEEKSGLNWTTDRYRLFRVIDGCPFILGVVISFWKCHLPAASFSQCPSVVRTCIPCLSALLNTASTSLMTLASAELVAGAGCAPAFSTLWAS